MAGGEKLMGDWVLNLIYYYGDVIIIVQGVTFHSIIKSSLLRLLYTLTHLLKGTTLQPLQLDFISRPRSQSLDCHFSHFCNKTRGKAHKPHDHAPIPNIPTPLTLRPKPSTTYTPPRQAPCRAAPFRASASRWRNVSLAFCENGRNENRDIVSGDAR